MERSQVIEVLGALASGVDPATGEELPPGGLLGQAQVIRALAAAVALLQGRKAASQATPSLEERNREAGLPLRSNSRWAPEEEATMREELLGGASIGEVARRHDRTRGAIVSRLRHLGLLGPEEYRLPALEQDALVRQRLSEPLADAGAPRPEPRPAP